MELWIDEEVKEISIGIILQFPVVRLFRRCDGDGWFVLLLLVRIGNCDQAKQEAETQK